MSRTARRRPRSAGSAAVLAAAAAPVATTAETVAAPETLGTALPVARGELVLREQLLYRRATGDPGAADREATALGGISVPGCAVTPHLAPIADPGPQRVTTRRIAEAIVQLPAVREPNGSALRDAYVVRAGFRIDF